MATLTRTWQQNSRMIYVALLIVLIVLVVFSPAEATLGNVVKIVYLHGAAERIAEYCYLIAGALGLIVSLRGALFATKQSPTGSETLAPHPFGSAGVALQKPLAMTSPLIAWTRAFAETAILFWLAHFVISAPAQVLAWGSFTLNEPRVASALWILAMTMLVYIVARWIAEPLWMAFAAIANAAILLIVLRGAVNILHPGSAILLSDSDVMKIFYVGIVIVCGVIAVQIARDLAARYTAH